MAGVQNQSLQLDKPTFLQVVGATQQRLMRDQDSELVLNKSSSPDSTSLSSALVWMTKGAAKLVRKLLPQPPATP